MLRWILSGTLALAAIGTVQANELTVGEITIDHPWARATAAQQANGAAYLVVDNGGEADRILGAASPVAGRVELHNHIDDNGVMRMRRVEAIDLPAGETTALAPGGLHIMLFELGAPLVVGETFPLTLTLEQAGAVEVEVTVEPVSYGIGGDAKGHQGHGSGG
ncbi:MAG: copper chaperone PCu(A)C [Geminicoccaceae bacterium]|nr:copper chaperone PCu(A)C [Geminicoccaceae bacterium]MCB9968709.1 copper chaperone PCu(A)C [Geminicoccaceae bacterium]HRY23892.1 copper chaperone PCu(A)C [Geminicoccaceae bacterium]